MGSWCFALPTTIANRRPCGGTTDADYDSAINCLPLDVLHGGRPTDVEADIHSEHSTTGSREVQKYSRRQRLGKPLPRGSKGWHRSDFRRVALGKKDRHRGCTARHACCVAEECLAIRPSCGCPGDR